MHNSDRLLLASIHDVGPHFESQIDMLAARLEQLLGEPRFAMLVVPNHWGQAPLSENKAFHTKLRAWSDRGVEMFVHGWYHKDESSHQGVAAFRAKHMTASEGEFLGLPYDVAAARMRDGRKLVEDITGKPVAGFIAPAWLYGPDALAALADCDFRIAEDHMRVWKPATQTTLARGPVITWASRSKARIASSIAFASIARAFLNPMKTVRIAVHPGDCAVPDLVTSIDRTFAHFAARRRVARYEDL